MERIPVERRRGTTAWMWLLLVLLVLVALYFLFMRGDTSSDLTELVVRSAPVVTSLLI